MPNSSLATDLHTGTMAKVKAGLKLMRPHQWTKNGFVILGTLFSHRFDVHSMGLAALVFIAFCAAASAVYIFNDLFDVESDRAHPKKRLRPIASGVFPAPNAWLLAMALALLSGGLAWKASPNAFMIVCAYAAINILYTIRLKNVVIVDVFVIATGFTQLCPIHRQPGNCGIAWHQPPYLHGSFCGLRDLQVSAPASCPRQR